MPDRPLYLRQLRGSRAHRPCSRRRTPGSLCQHSSGHPQRLSLQDAVESAEEILLLLKTSEAVFPKLRDRIIELHSYVTPEVIAVPITAGSGKYLSWLRAQLE